MRIFVHEFASGGGLAGRKVPASLGREGSAMLSALIADLVALPGVRVVTTVDPRFPQPPRAGLECVTLPARKRHDAVFDGLITSADAVWLIAPETDGSLERLASRVERRRRPLLGSGARSIRAAADKAGLARLLARRGIPYPTTRACGARSTWTTIKTIAERVGYPIVVKPARGAGCEGVSLVRDSRELRRAVDRVRQVNGRERLLLQEYVDGTPASVSLLADGRSAVALTVNSQWMRASRTSTSCRQPGVAGTLSYRGGTTPLEPRLARDAARAAVRTCEAIPGLRGYIGVDLVLTRSEAVVIEVNPRLTTAYLGVRSVVDENVAALAIAACQGSLPQPPRIRRSVRFTATGRIVAR
jgi:predicted ATP-grasp superfamily ATP-dependent carboligase